MQYFWPIFRRGSALSRESKPEVEPKVSVTDRYTEALKFRPLQSTNTNVFRN